MDFRRYPLIALLALIPVTVVAGLYISNFGIKWSPQHDAWGTFGDYFGGVLNPIFAVLGFLGVLHSLHLQRAQIRQMTADKHDEKLLDVVKDIDSRIAEILQVSVGFAQAENGQRVELHISHMVAEAGRTHNILNASDGYFKFIEAAKSPGTTINAPMNELREILSAMHSVVRNHPYESLGGYSPVIAYYIRKASRLIPVFLHIGGLTEDMKVFFTQKSWGSDSR